MTKKHIITIAGQPSSGKSTTAKGVAAALGYEHFSSGSLFRQLGQQRGLDVLQTNFAGERGDTEVDFQVDETLRKLGQEKDNLVIDSRTAWHWIPDSFKVLLVLDLKTGAERIINSSNVDKQRLASEDLVTDATEYAKILKERFDSENRRYKSLYDIDPTDLSNYDLVVDTAANNPVQVTQIVLDAYQKWLSD